MNLAGRIAGILLAGLAVAPSGQTDEGLSKNPEFRAFLYAQRAESANHQASHELDDLGDTWINAREAVTRAENARTVAETPGPHSRSRRAAEDAADLALLADNYSEQAEHSARRLMGFAEAAANHAQKAAEAAAEAETTFAQEQADRAAREAGIANNRATGAKGMVTGVAVSAAKVRDEADRAAQAAERAR